MLIDEGAVESAWVSARKGLSSTDKSNEPAQHRMLAVRRQRLAADDPFVDVDIVVVHQEIFEPRHVVVTKAREMRAGERPDQQVVFLHAGMVAAEVQPLAARGADIVHD